MNKQRLKTKTVLPDERLQAFRNDMLEVLSRHAGDLPADQMLSVAAYFVGQLIALQDQRTMTPDQALGLVSDNIELGNEFQLGLVAGPAAGRA